jgi:hypothetical protein
MIGNLNAYLMSCEETRTLGISTLTVRCSLTTAALPGSQHATNGRDDKSPIVVVPKHEDYTADSATHVYKAVRTLESWTERNKKKNTTTDVNRMRVGVGVGV